MPNKASRTTVATTSTLPTSPTPPPQPLHNYSTNNAASPHNNSTNNAVSPRNNSSPFIDPPTKNLHPIIIFITMTQVAELVAMLCLHSQTKCLGFILPRVIFSRSTTPTTLNNPPSPPPPSIEHHSARVLSDRCQRETFLPLRKGLLVLG